MPLPDLTLWMLTTLVEAFVVWLFLIRGLFRKFLFLNFYLLLSIMISIGRYASSLISATSLPDTLISISLATPSWRFLCS